MEKIKIIFNNKNNKQELLYRVVSNPVSALWIKKIKHLSYIPHNIFESTGYTFQEHLSEIHKEFCKFAGIKFNLFNNYDDQKTLNILHVLYEENHDHLSKLPNNDILYKFHYAIHQKNDTKNNNNGQYFFIGWGTKEGPLTEKFMCNKFYAEKLIKNNLYLPWTELGKTPMAFYKNREETKTNRFYEIVKPHLNLRAKFSIALKDSYVENFSTDFKTWFEPLKQKWLEYYSLSDWRPCDEYSGVLLAESLDKTIDIEQVLNEYPTFHSIKLV